MTRVSAIVRALRPYQWAKNSLVLVPVLTSHRLWEIQVLGPACLAVIAFCLCASSVYVLNDLLDLEADRAHPRKSKRPFASGELPLSVGFVLAPLLLLSAAAVALPLPKQFQLVLALYYGLTLVYSLGLKARTLLDVLTLACLYTLRIVSGAAATAIPLSFWLLWFSMFIFLSLAFVKRYTELDALHRQHGSDAKGRGYTVRDLALLESLGTSAGYLSVVVLALYINSPEIESLYRRPEAIWFICVLTLYWISLVWLKAHRGEMHDDPVVFALKDRVSIYVGILAAITIAVAM